MADQLPFFFMTAYIWVTLPYIQATKILMWLPFAMYLPLSMLNLHLGMLTLWRVSYE